MNKKYQSEDVYVKLAKKTLETYVSKKQRLNSKDLDLSDKLLNERSGAFVSIKTKDGDLRGCIGTISPYAENIAEEIINNAISAGTQDPRFYPVRAEELKNLVYTVDILKAPEKIQSVKDLDVKRYGVIVRKGNRTGLLLPNLEGINSPEEQISIALRKAGIGKTQEYTMERFEVIRHE